MLSAGHPRSRTAVTPRARTAAGSASPMWTCRSAAAGITMPSAATTSVSSGTGCTLPTDAITPPSRSIWTSGVSPPVPSHACVARMLRVATREGYATPASRSCRSSLRSSWTSSRGRAADRLDQGRPGPQEPLLVGVEDRDERHLGEIEPLPEQVDPDQDVELAEPEIPDDLDPLQRVDLRVEVPHADAHLDEVVGQV